MAVAYVAASATTIELSGTNTATITSYSTSGSDRAIVCSFTQSASPDRTISSVVRGGSENFTAEWVASPYDSGFKSTLSEFIGPATAAADIVLTLSGNSSGIFSAHAYTGASAAGATASAAGDNDATPSVDVSSETDALVIDAISYDAAITSSDNTQIWFDETGANNDHMGSNAAGAATVTMGYTVDSVSTGNQYALAAGELEPVAVGGTTPKGPLGHPFHGAFGGPIGA